MMLLLVQLIFVLLVLNLLMILCKTKHRWARRKERGQWVLGFLGCLEDCTSLEAELLGIFSGPEMIQNHRMDAMEVVTDSTTLSQ